LNRVTLTVVARGVGVVGALAAAAVLAAAASAAPLTERVSVSSRGLQAQHAAFMCGSRAITPNGRFVLFRVKSRGLAPSDGPGWDLFMRDRVRGTTTLIPGSAAWCSMTSDGRYVAFSSGDGVLVPGDNNNAEDIFVYDVKRQTARRILRSDGGQIDAGAAAPSLSHDGRYIAFVSWSAQLARRDANEAMDVFVRDRRRGTTRLVSRALDGRAANQNSSWPLISGNGRYVAFSSHASNIVPNDTNRRLDVFVHDRLTRRIVWSSVAATGGELGPVHHWRAYSWDISASGRYVLFTSDAANLVADDNDRVYDVFVHDLDTDTTQRASVASGGRPACLAPPGPLLHCYSYASLSPDGRFVSYTSRASDLVPGDTNNAGDVFVHDTRTRITWRASLTASGQQITCRGGTCTLGSAISARGRFVVFVSPGRSVVPGDTNLRRDVFVRGPFAGPASEPGAPPTRAG
jgi:Tol biopolymer transport system component